MKQFCGHITATVTAVLLFLCCACAAAAAEAPGMPAEELVIRDIPTVEILIDETKGTIAAMNEDYDHDTVCRGTVAVTVPEGYTTAYASGALTGGTYELDYIRGRGNSTWHAEKKPYKMKLSKGADLLGMGKGKHWVLIANYYDPTMIRNEFTFRLRRRWAWSSRRRPHRST